jgi:hypothetical protein
LHKSYGRQPVPEHTGSQFTGRGKHTGSRFNQGIWNPGQ